MQLKQSSCRIHIPPLMLHSFVRYFLTTTSRAENKPPSTINTYLRPSTNRCSGLWIFHPSTFAIYRNGYTRLGRPTNCESLCFLQPSYTRPENSVVVPQWKTIPRSLVCSIGPRSLRPQAHHDAFWALLPPSFCPIRLVSDIS